MRQLYPAVVLWIAVSRSPVAAEKRLRSPSPSAAAESKLDAAGMATLMSSRSLAVVKYHESGPEQQGFNALWKEIESEFSEGHVLRFFSVNCTEHVALCAARKVQLKPGASPIIKFWTGEKWRQYAGGSTLAALREYLSKKVMAAMGDDYSGGGGGGTNTKRRMHRVFHCMNASSRAGPGSTGTGPRGKPRAREGAAAASASTAAGAATSAPIAAAAAASAPTAAAAAGGSAICETQSCILHLLAARRLSTTSALEYGIEEALALDAAAARQSQLWLEFGAHNGSTTWQISRAHHVHSFDSFLGLPEKWRSAPKGQRNEQWFFEQHLDRGSYSRGGRPPFHSAAVSWHVGLFEATLPRFITRLGRVSRKNVSFVHVDCDLYSSSSLVLTRLAHVLSPGAILVFGGLINYPEFEEHEMRALLELLARTGRRVRVLGTSARYVGQTRRQVEDFIWCNGAEKTEGYG